MFTTTMLLAAFTVDGAIFIVWGDYVALQFCWFARAMSMTNVRDVHFVISLTCLFAAASPLSVRQELPRAH